MSSHAVARPDAVLLVVAKAPEPGRVKTRLGAVVGDERAADLAAAALLDTLRTGSAAFGPGRTHLALSGDLARATRAAELEAALGGWTIWAQHGADLAARLRHAHEDVAASSGAAVVQIGMDTPQVAPTDLLAAGARLADRDAVLGEADDGGWWLLAVGSPALVAGLDGVPMSRPDTAAATRRALRAAGACVRRAPTSHDVDTVEDAERVARLVPESEFGRAWLEGASR